ncbi:E3 ubiquitin-protein ligase listerin [Copidosoma floridanum]|uniref:E3 ubiquitin-protein ligase listerin n=1 Tax=Copidosoma floridanum TaxID=29053 RepID=UPI0006C9A8E1|nr:E3 ubiquitin-protein ligase listerin [Copidosoma floridanum]
MGKAKGQRTKGNARPSNSSRSAELLGTAATNFVGFAAAKDGGFTPILPGLSITQNTEVSSLDPAFQLVLKKMSKKDSTTKYKALLEFSELCINLDLSVVETMLPCWPRYYCSLSIDVDHRVREAAQMAHAALVKRVGKMIATILKQVAGPWFVSQYDVYPPAASAASNCLNNTFPPQKYVSAVVHCQDEILSYICDNITVLTPQGLSTNKSIPPEEMNSKYQKILTSSLQAYNFYLKTVTPADIEKTAVYHKKIINSGKFWKLVKNEDSSTKAAFFNALSALVCCSTIIACEEKKKVLTSIMNSLDEIDPALLTAVWESLLVAINKIEDWYKIVSIDKLVLPKLWRVLKNGGQYCASVVYPNLLPFLSQFQKFEVDEAMLFTSFFENMRQGFSVKSVKFSRSEAFAVVTSFVECLKYAILVNNDNEDICKSLLKDQLMPVVESCLSESQTICPIFFCELAHLLRYWSKNSDSSDNAVYGRMMEIFWHDLAATFDRLIDKASESSATSAIVSSMTDLLQYLKIAPEHSRRNMKVKFSDSKEAKSPPKDLALTPMSVDKSNTEAVAFLKELQQLITRLCVGYFRRITDQPLKHKVADLVRLVAGHESKGLFQQLAKTYDEDASLLQFYYKNLKIMLNSENGETEDLINLIFSIMSHMSEAEKQEVLQSFLEIDDIKVRKIAVQRALMKKYREDRIVRKWCKQSLITSTLITTAQDVMSSLEMTEFDENMFVRAFEPTAGGDLVVSSEAICGISSTLCQMVNQMPWKSEKLVKKTGTLLSRLLAMSCSHKKITSGAVDLLKAVFILHIRDSMERIDNDSESSMVVATVQEAWTYGLCEISKKISEDDFAKYVKYFATIVWEKIFSTSDTKDSLISLSTSLIDAVIKSSEHYSKKYVMSILTELDIKTWMIEASGTALYGEVITGNLYVSDLVQKGQMCGESFEIDLRNVNFEDSMHKCLKWAAASAKILNQLLPNTADVPEIVEILINLSCTAALGKIYVKHYNSTKHSIDVNSLSKVLHSELNGLKTFLPEDVHKKVLANLNRLLSTSGAIYAYVIKFYRDFFIPEDTLSELFENCDVDSIKESNSIEVYLQCFQLLKNCAGLKKFVSSLDDQSDFYTIYLARIELSHNDLSHLTDIFDLITKRQQDEPLALLLNCDIHDVDWKDFILPLEVILFLIECVVKIPKKLTIAQWDVIDLCLASWQLSFRKSIAYHTDFKVKALTINVNKLYCIIQEIVNDYVKNPIEEIPFSFIDEWKNVFSSHLQKDSFESWMMFAELYNNKDTSLTSIIPLNYLGKSLKVYTNPLIDVDSSMSLCLKSEEEIIELLLKLIHSPVLSLQLGAYIALNNIADVLVQRDKEIIGDEKLDVKTFNMCKFEQILKMSQNIVNTILMDFKLCDTTSCTIQPYTDSYTYTIGYLLAWSVVLNMCAKANGDLRYHYAEILKEDFFPCLLNNLFRLMPVEVLQDSKNKSIELINIFSSVPSLDFMAGWTEWRLDHLVCSLYTNCLRYLPVLVRQWWSTADSRVSTAVDKITTLYVSPFLCHEELYDNKLAQVDNMQVKVHPMNREVIALYQMDDTTLELNITLPPNHPLGTVTVEPGQHVGGTANWRNCHMQLSIFLTHQNGSIWDGLMLWKTNLDKRYAGVEECYICFSIFHLSTYQIPKLSCHTCRKKFHTPCLYKWFNTSHKSACPICRNPF